MTKLKIAVLGDSMSAQSFAWDDLWPTVLERNLRQNGVDCEVRTFAINAHTFYRINTSAAFNGKTALSACLLYKPDIAIVACGFNDTVQDVDARTQAQVKSDAETVFLALDRFGTDVVLYGRQLAFDEDNFSPATLRNKGVVPSKMTLPAAGILSGSYTDQMLDDAIDAATQSAFADWVDLDIFIQNLPYIDGVIDFKGFKVGRLGLMTTDGLHVNSIGHKLLAADCAYQLRVLQQTQDILLGGLADQLIPEWENVDSLFDTYLTASGDGYIVNATSISNTNAATIANLGHGPNLANYFMPYKAEFSLTPKSLTNATTNDGQFQWHITGAKPNQQMELSINSGAFFDLTYADGSLIKTDSFGNAADISLISNIVTAFGLAAPTTITALFKCGDSVFQEISIDVTA